MSREEALLTGKINNELIKGVSLIGNVLKSENQRIKLKLEIDNEQDTDAACWFPYASQANNLFYGSITKLMGFRIPHIINSAHINEF